MPPRNTSSVALADPATASPSTYHLRRTRGRHLHPLTSVVPLTPPPVLCQDNHTCACLLSDHLTDAERETINDIFRQAARLSTVFSWLFMLTAVGLITALLLS